MKIIIDADACPKTVLQICLRTGNKYAIPVWTVANFNHQVQSDLHIVVGSDSQEADIKVANLTQPGDVVITQDWGLAAMVLGKGAHCFSPQGMEFKAENMDFLLEVREAKAKLRRGGGRTKGPKKRSPGDDTRFEEALVKVIGG